MEMNSLQQQNMNNPKRLPKNPFVAIIFPKAMDIMNSISEIKKKEDKTEDKTERQSYERKVKAKSQTKSKTHWMSKSRSKISRLNRRTESYSKNVSFVCRNCLLGNSIYYPY